MCLAPSFFKSYNPKIKASYSAMLLEHWKLNLYEWPSESLVCEFEAHMPAPDPSLQTTPSKLEFHKGSSGSSCSLISVWHSSV